MSFRVPQDRIIKPKEKKNFLSRKNFIKVEGSVKQAIQMTHGRLLFTAIIFCLAFTSVSLRLFDVVVFNNVVVKDRKDPFDLTEMQIDRGDIVDRNGVLLASNLSTASLYANPKDIMDPKEVALLLNQAFPEMSYNDLLKKLETKKSFVWIKRNLAPKEEYLVNNLGQPGLYFQREEKRVYPHGRLFSHIIGYVGMDGHGLAGMERQFDKNLVSDETKDQPLQLSIDVRVQDVLYHELGAAVSEFSALGGSGLVMDVDSGEIIASVSLPDFDPNSFSKANAAQKFNANTLGVYEMGSIFKSFNIAIGLDAGKINLSDVYDTVAPIKIGGFTISDFHPEKRPLTVPEVYMYSSNIGSAKIAVDIGPVIQKKYLENIGLLDELDIELPEKGNPMYPKTWKKISSMTISYGHGIAVTPLHLITAILPVINGGTYHAATLLKKTNEQLLNDQGTRVFKKSTSLAMRKLMRLVVEKGTGKKADVEGYLVGGKTGTAEKLQTAGGYSANAKISSFIGVFPISNPRYAIFIMLDEPKGTVATGGYATGGMTAAPVVGKVVEKIGPMLGVIPVNKESKNIKEAMAINIKGNKLAAN